MVVQVAVAEQIQLIHTQAEPAALAPQDKETTGVPDLQGQLLLAVVVDQEAQAVMLEMELVVLVVLELPLQLQDQALPELEAAVEVVAQSMEVVVVLALVVVEMVEHLLVVLLWLLVHQQLQIPVVAVVVHTIPRAVMVVQVSWSSAIPMPTLMLPAPQDRPHFPTPAVTRYIHGPAVVQ